MRSASAPSSERPVSSRSSARARPISRGSRCVPPAPGSRPRRTSGTPSCGLRRGDAQRACERELQATAERHAFDRRDRRLRQRRQLIEHAAQVRQVARRIPSLSSVAMSFRSAPAAKNRGTAEVITTVRDAATCGPRIAARSSASRSRDRAFAGGLGQGDGRDAGQRRSWSRGPSERSGRRGRPAPVRSRLDASCSRCADAVPNSAAAVWIRLRNRCRSCSQVNPTAP